MFNPTIRRSGRPGDLAVLISASGDSENINNVSVLCKEEGVETISISGNGRITNDIRSKSDYPFIIPIKDQQILEDVTLGAVYIIGEIVQHKVEGKEYDINKVKQHYLDDLVNCFSQLSAHKIDEIAKDIVQAYKKGKQIKVDGLSGLLDINAKHMQHNLKWDAFQDIDKRLANRVNSGLPTYHFSGVGNDGGEGFNYAIEIDDNYDRDDVGVLFIRDFDSKPVQTLIKAAQRKGMKIHSICFNTDNEYVASNLAQVVVHLTSRIINSYLWSEGDYGKFGERLKEDLALLRQAETTKQKLERIFYK